MGGRWTGTPGPAARSPRSTSSSPAAGATCSPTARSSGTRNTPSTTDLRAVQRGTADVFPDWRQEITTIRGGDDWAVFEWIGRATYAGAAPTIRLAGTPIEMHGASIVEVDGDGLVTKWTDYLDRKEPEVQLRAASAAVGAGPS